MTVLWSVLAIVCKLYIQNALSLTPVSSKDVYQKHDFQATAVCCFGTFTLPGCVFF